MNIKYLIISLSLITFLVFTFFTNSFKEHSTLILFNGKIYSADENNSTYEAVAIEGNKIIGVGTSEFILKHFESKNKIDLKNKTVFPGFIDAHTHVSGIGKSFLELNLVSTNSKEEIVNLVKQKIESKNDEWIFGRGWDQNDWDDKNFPTKNILNEISNTHFIVLYRIDGHAMWVNSKVLEVANITKETVEIDGGKIVRDEFGEPTGILIDNAMQLVENIIPKNIETRYTEIFLGISKCIENGLTEIHDMGIDVNTISVYAELAQQNQLPIRIYGAIDGNDTIIFKFISKPIINFNNFTLRATKFSADGALGSRGAALNEPYSDDKKNTGILNFSDVTKQQMKTYFENGFQICTHAIGDRANKEVLDYYEKILDKKTNSRLRIEHAQVLRKEDIVRFKILGIIPSMQPTHATSDMYWAENRLGNERIKYAYAWKDILNSHSIIASGSDAPVENVNPILGFYAAITRADKFNYPESGWYGNQKMTRTEALKSFTIWAAYSAFEESWKGTIGKGKIADFTILSKDIMQIHEKEILSTEVEMTIVDGKVIYNKSEMNNK